MVVFGFFGNFGVFDVDGEDSDEDGAAHPAGEDRVEGRHFGTIAGDGIDFNFVRFYRGRDEIGDGVGVVLEKINDIFKSVVRSTK